jgi:hypothetical protein
MNFIEHRIKSKREIANERRSAAEEKKRLEEDKAKVKENVFTASRHRPTLLTVRRIDGSSQSHALKTKSGTVEENQSLMTVCLLVVAIVPLPGRIGDSLCYPRGGLRSFYFLSIRRQYTCLMPAIFPSGGIGSSFPIDYKS